MCACLGINSYNAEANWKLLRKSYHHMIQEMLWEINREMGLMVMHKNVQIVIYDIKFEIKLS